MKTGHETKRVGWIVVAGALGFTGCNLGGQEPTSKAVGSAAQPATRRAEPIFPGSAARTAAARAKPGELIVKYRSEGALAVTECVERWLTEKRSFASATADRSASLDALHQALGVRGARALMPGRSGLSTQAATQRLQASTMKALTLRRLPGAARPSRSFAELANLYVLELPAGADVEAAARQLAADPHVEYAQPNYRMKTTVAPNDPYFSSTGSWGQAEDDLWGIKRAGFPAAWSTALGDGVVVAIVDSGLDLGHPDIQGNVWQNPGEIPNNGVDDDGNGFVDDAHGWNFALGSNDVTDQFGHGTAVAGIIAAVGNNGLGIIGAAPHAKILPITGFAPDGTGDTATLAQGIIYAAQSGARVINNSWGCNDLCPENPVAEEAVDVAHALGVTVVFAAGNSTDDTQNYSPQNRPNVVLVGATDPQDQPSFFTNFGFLDVMAPGSGSEDPPPDFDPFRGILSLKSAICSPDICPPELLVGDGYLRQAGTSFSAPFAAGLAALIVAQHPEYAPEDVRQVLHRGARDLRKKGFDLDTGFGRINAGRSLAEPTPLQALIAAPAQAEAIRTSAPVPITGTAAGPGFSSYRLDVASTTDLTKLTPVASGTTPVTDGLLGMLDLGTIPDGTFALRLQATNAGGAVYEDYQALTLSRGFITDPVSSDLYSDLGPKPDMPFYRSGALIDVRGTAAPGNLVSYALNIRRSDGSLLKNAHIILPSGGTSPVDGGLLGTWDTTGVLADAYTIELRVKLASGADETAMNIVAVDPTLHPGWPLELTALLDENDDKRRFQEQLTAADVDGDGASELCIGYGTSVRLLTHQGVDLPGWPQTVDPSNEGRFVSKAPIVADVTGDAAPEVIASNDAGELFVWDRAGALLVHAVDAGAVFIAADDIDGDGQNDLVTTNASGVLAVSRVQGGELVTWFEETFPDGPLLSAPALGDVDGDGQKELVVSATAPIYDPSTGGLGVTDLYVVGLDGVRPGFPQRINSGTPARPDSSSTFTTIYPSNPSLGDVDANGQLDIAIGDDSGHVLVFRPDGTSTPGWPQATNPTPMNSPTLGDFDGDGRLDVLAGSGYVFNAEVTPDFQAYLYAFTANGSVIPGYPRSYTKTPSYIFFGYGSVALADVDGDGGVEAVVASDGDYMRPHLLNAYKADGSTARGFPKVTNATGSYSTSSAAMADFDGDGKLELAFVDYSLRIYLWDLAAPASAKRPWPMLGHDPQHTGRASRIGRRRP